MLIDANKQEFAEILRGTAEAYGKEATQNLLKIFWAALSGYEMSQVRAAFTAHIRTSKFMASPAEIIDKIESTTGSGQRPGADEAWGMIPKDEHSSAVLTEEMLKAYSVAAPMLHDGDKIGARMAFKDAYNRICDESRAKGIPIKWVISRGWDKKSLGSVVTEALRLGRLKPEDAAPVLSEIEYHAPMIAGLLTGTKGTANEDRAREFLAKLKGSLVSPVASIDMDRVRKEVEEKDRKLQEGESGKAA